MGAVQEGLRKREEDGTVERRGRGLGLGLGLYLRT
jgi:hypothetical protein